MTRDEDDATLFVQLSQGSTAALATLYDRHAPVIYALALRLAGGERAPAEDLTHDTFLALARHARRRDLTPPRVLGWLVVHLLESAGRASTPTVDV
ncbi:MAG: hypothetical protein KF773_08925 [Deltaproteobacteria bacterium]|nr:hypothetical protein [Deltaproteobacteria bacterium]MCW5801287.1 hypothetical protein [Deltaproteobacteria bacterium]